MHQPGVRLGMTGAVALALSCGVDSTPRPGPSTTFTVDAGDHSPARPDTGVGRDLPPPLPDSALTSDAADQESRDPAVPGSADEDAAVSGPVPADTGRPVVATVSPLLPQGTWEVDLTSGEGGERLIEATGGEWGAGWRVTSALGDRLVWDMGRPIKSGILEVSVTLNKHPHETPGKIEWAGLYELASLDQDQNGDVFYARVGRPAYQFSKIKAGGTWFLNNGQPMSMGSEWEKTIGASGNWIADDKTVHLVKFEWRGGKAIFHDTKGGTHVCSGSACGGQHPVDELRYVFVGADKWKRFNCGSDCDNLSAVGMRYLKLKLIDNTAP